MNRNYEALRPSVLNDKDKMPVQDNPTLEIQYATLLQIREYVLALAESIQFDINAGVSVGTGQMAYNAIEDTFDIGMLNGVVGQLCQEFQYPVCNVSGSIIINGTLCMSAGGVCEGSDNMDCIPFDGDRANARYILGVATHDIPAQDLPEVTGFGKLTKNGKVRDIKTDQWVTNPVLWAAPAGGGTMVDVEPLNSEIGMPVAFVLKSHPTEGVIYVRITSFDEHVAKVNPVVLSWGSPRPVKDAVENVHGGLYPIAVAQDLSAGFAISVGVGKLVFVVNDALPDCEMTATGTIVDRDSGVESGPTDSVMTVDTQTDDTSALDTNGVLVTDFVDAYITDQWFTGVITLAGVGSNIPTNVDVYQVAFEQFNDAEVIEIIAGDLTYETISDTGMYVSAYVFGVIVVDDKVDIGAVILETRSSTTGAFVSGVPYRARRVPPIPPLLDGRKDGIFAQVTLGGINKFLNVNTKIWANTIK